MSVIEVAIEPGIDPGTFMVRVLSSPAGEASAVSAFDARQVLARQAELQQAVLASAVVSRKALSKTERPLREVGQALFNASLGVGEIAGRYRAAAAVAVDRGQELRIVLRIDDPLLASLPWEAMHDEAAGEYVCRRHQLVRYVPVASPVAPLMVDPPLRILGVVSSPRNLPALNIDKEQRLLDAALARLTAEGIAEVSWAPDAEWANLQDLLLGGRWHVVHFIGHGDFDPDRDEGVLALVGDDGRKDLVEASRLVDLLRQARPVPRLVVLNSCGGAAMGTTDLFSGTAAALVRAGVNAVAAMQYEISDPAAAAFARGFYGALAQGRGIDEAILSGRVAIVGLSGQTLEWVTPVLYLRGQEAHLFDVAASRSSAGPRLQHGSADAALPATSAKEPGKGTGTPGSRPAAHVPTRLVRTLTHHNDCVLDVVFSPDGRLLASAGDDGMVGLWEAATGAEVRTLARQSSGASGVDFSPGGRMLASASIRVCLWDTATGKELRTLTRFDTYAVGVRFSPDGRLLASSGNDGTVKLWEVATGAEVHTLTGHFGEVQGLAFDPSGRLLASAGDEGTVKLWDVAAGGELRTLTAHAGLALAVGFDPDGLLLASAGADKRVRLWDVATGTEVRALSGHTDWVRSVAFSPDGSLLASAGDDGTVRLWKVSKGRPVATLTKHTDYVRAVAFSPDGELLASAGDDHTVRLWS